MLDILCMQVVKVSYDTKKIIWANEPFGMCCIHMYMHINYVAVAGRK